jgi:UDP-N-acetylglucosamine--N-acetylmuramyl-(pentapeptide) pyrophosphoryl-undecaprenol N-acetylglucosamine transferase
MFRLPALLVPYPYAADDHQTRNAEIFVKANAAIMVEEGELTGDLLAEKIRDLFVKPETLRAMSANVATLAPSNAADLIAETLEKYCHSNDAVAA